MEKWNQDLQAKYNYLADKYGKDEPTIDDAFINRIKWRDHELADIKEPEMMSNIVIIGDIQPPLSSEELEVLAQDPKFCIEGIVTLEKISISLEEGKVKRLWSEMFKEVEENEEGEGIKPTEGEKEAEKEADYSSRRVYDFNEKSFNFANLKCTDTPFNRRTFLPSKTKPRLEVEESMRRRRVMEETEEWIKLNCDDKGNQSRTNIDPKMKLGIKNLKERVDKGEVIVVPTDKSGKFSIMPMDVYKSMGLVHIVKDKIISEDRLTELQRELNNHVKMFTKIFDIGSTHGERNVERIHSGFTTGANSVAVLWLMPKDHKEVKEGVPMPSRPVVSITNTLLARFSKLVTTVVKTLADNIAGTTKVKSGENLKADVIKLNAKLKREEEVKAGWAGQEEEMVDPNLQTSTRHINEDMPLITISEDVKALYPSIKKNRAAIVTREAMENTGVTFHNVNYRMALRFIAKASTQGQIRAWGLHKWCPVRTKRWGARPGMMSWKTLSGQMESYQGVRL